MMLPELLNVATAAGIAVDIAFASPVTAKISINDSVVRTLTEGHGFIEMEELVRGGEVCLTTRFRGPNTTFVSVLSDELRDFIREAIR